VLFLAAAAVGADQPPEEVSIEDRLDRFVRREMHAYGIPGLAYTVVKGDALLCQGAFGTAGGKRKMTVRTPMQAASLAKSFTAAGVLQLAAGGAVDPEAPVRSYLPRFTVDAPAGYPPIRIRDLLYQSSGLSERSYTPDLSDTAGLREAVADLARAIPQAPPGQQFNYFNPNYTVLGLLVEQLSGLSYPEYCERHLFQPLGMECSRMLPCRVPPGMAACEGAGPASAEPAKGHGSFFGIPFERETERSVYCGPSGGLITTAEDMSSYLLAQLNGGADPRRGARILSPAATALSHRPGIGDQSGGYAMGWITGRYGDSRLIRHGGSLPGHRSILWLLPERELGIAVLMNQNGFLPATLAYSSIPAGIADVVEGREPPRPFPLRLLYAGLGLLILALLGLHFRWWLRHYPRLKDRARERGGRALVPGIVLRLILAAVFAAGLPQAGEALLERGLSWQLAFTMEPAAAITAALPVLFALAGAVGGAAAMVSGSPPARAD
jgi:CubicO group peptidase (beta-lactamase class C family)